MNYLTITRIFEDGTFNFHYMKTKLKKDFIKHYKNFTDHGIILSNRYQLKKYVLRMEKKLTEKNLWRETCLY